MLTDILKGHHYIPLYLRIEFDHALLTVYDTPKSWEEGGRTLFFMHSESPVFQLLLEVAMV